MLGTNRRGVKIVSCGVPTLLRKFCADAHFALIKKYTLLIFNLSTMQQLLDKLLIITLHSLSILFLFKSQWFTDVHIKNTQRIFKNIHFWLNHVTKQRPFYLPTIPWIQLKKFILPKRKYSILIVKFLYNVNIFKSWLELTNCVSNFKIYQKTKQ